MRIGIDARLWNETGVGRYVRNLVRELQVIDEKNEYILFIRSEDYENVKQQTANSKWQIRIADIRWHSVAEQVMMPVILNKENLDLVHFPYFSVPIAYQRPYVITIHDLIIYHFPTGKSSTLPLPFYKAKHFSYKHIVSQAAKNAKKIIAPLETTKEDIVRTLHTKPEKIAVTHEGFDAHIKGDTVSDKTAKKKIADRDYFLYVGNAYPHKNLEKLVEGFALFMQKQNNPVYFFFIGQDDYFYERLQIFVHRKSINNIEFFHDITDAELAYFYSQAKALVSPSNMEGFGLTPLEAMAEETPVLVSDIPSFHEVCGEAAFYFNQKQIGAIAEALENVYTLDTKKRQVLLEKGLTRTKQFSWATMAKQTLSVYEDSIGLRQGK